MSIGRNSGEVFFNPAYHHSQENVAKNEPSNVIPLQVIYENTSSSFRNSIYDEAEFISNRNSDNDDEEGDIYKRQLLLFLRQNNLLKKSSDDTQQLSMGYPRSPESITDSESGF